MCCQGASTGPREGWRSPLNLTAQILEVGARGLVGGRKLGPYEPASKKCSGTQWPCDAWSLLSGRVNGAKIYGDGWRSPLNLTGGVVECEVLDRASGYVIVTRASGRVVHLWDSTASIAGSSSTPANWHIL